MASSFEKIKKVDMRLTALVLALAGILTGLALGIVIAPGKGGALAVTGLDTIPSETIASLTAEVQGAVVRSTSDSVTLTANGKEVTLAVPAALTSFTLTETTPYTEADQTVWETYQADLKSYGEAMAAYQPSDDMSAIATLPVYPVPPFQVAGYMPIDPQAAAAAGQTKIASRNVTATDLKKGDLVRAVLSFSTPMVAYADPQQASQARTLLVVSLSASR